MGNVKSTSCTNATSITEQDLRLNDYDMTIYEKRKEKIFKGTIAISVVYALIALIILITSYLFPTIKYVIFEKFLPFTIVFIVGTIILIIYLFYNILNFEPIKINKNYDYTNISCPDYWTLEYKPDLKNYFDSNSINPSIFNYRCVLDDNILSKTDLYFNQSNKLKDYQAIGMTNSFTSDNISSSVSINKESYDIDNTKYYYINLKHADNIKNNYNIVKNYDSNVDRSLLESTLLMNNYVSSKPDKDKTTYTHYSKNNSVDFDANKTDNKIDFVKSVYTGATVLTKDNLITIPDDNNNLINSIKVDGSVPTNIPLVCNRVYPLLLAAKDKELSKNSSGKYDENVLRCAYSKMCGIPWSDMNCYKYK